jgi:glutamine amidotransferase
VKLAIIDYGAGNLRSVEKAFAAVGCEAIVSADEKVLLAADKLVLPGVGAFGACMKELKRRGFDELAREKAASGAPLLGICVGMQMLFEVSEEFGETAGLGLLRGRARPFPSRLRAPHVGWNAVKHSGDNVLWHGIDTGAYFYFVHSFYCDTPQSAAQTVYEGLEFTSAVAVGNVFGTQFHPEKSQTAGLRLLQNFAAI